MTQEQEAIHKEHTEGGKVIMKIEGKNLKNLSEACWMQLKQCEERHL